MRLKSQILTISNQLSFLSLAFGLKLLGGYSSLPSKSVVLFRPDDDIESYTLPSNFPTSLLPYNVILWSLLWLLFEHIEILYSALTLIGPASHLYKGHSTSHRQQKEALKWEQMSLMHHENQALLVHIWTDTHSIWNDYYQISRSSQDNNVK